MRGVLFYLFGNFSSCLQLVLEDRGHQDADQADNQPTEEGVPPDRVTDHQRNAKRLANHARKPEQEGVDHKREQSQRQDNECTGQEFKQWTQQCVDQTEDERQPQQRRQSALQVDAGYDQNRQV